jgi:hypothetical protein
MMTANEDTVGGCMCGNVRFATSGQPDRVLNCHCRSCRTHTGAPMATLAVFRASQVIFTGIPRKPFRSAPEVERAFCPECGTSMTWETTFGDEGRLCAIHISCFDEPDMLPPGAHSFHAEKLSWFEAFDNLPRHEGFVANSRPIQIGPSRL